MIETVVGKEATIHFDAHKCIHSRTCVLSHPDVFVPNIKGEWIHPDVQPVEELMHIAKSCPLVPLASCGVICLKTKVPTQMPHHWSILFGCEKKGLWR